MDRVVLIVVFGFLANVRSGSTLGYSDEFTGSESVWLKDVTPKIQTQKRIFGDPYLPHQLKFHIRRGSGTLTLRLKRNYEIDPNADIYFVQRTKDGRSTLSKTTLERDAVAYYQDMDNHAYMTVRCINSLNQQCERIISGNIQIGDRSYDLRPAGTDDAAENLLDVRDSINRRYLLLDQTHLQHEHLVENRDASYVNEAHVRWELKTLFRSFTREEKQQYYHLPDDKLSSRNRTDLQDRGTPGNIRQLKQNYYVNVAILIDSGVWDLYSSKVTYVRSSRKTKEVKRRIREAYSHIMNGVNLRYKTIDDPEISISVIPTFFIFFKNEAMFPHNRSKVTIENGKKYIESKPYLDDLSDWDKNIGANNVPKFDHTMLFTTHILHTDSASSNRIGGVSNMWGVCDPGKRTSVIQSRHYVGTVGTAAHELGHSLGAFHDGEDEATACKPEDCFLMSAIAARLSRNRTYIKNMWTFSNCSVESFKKTLKNKECVKHTGSLYNINEFDIFMMNQPGDVFTPQEQCSLVYGPGYLYYGDVSEDLCYLLKCMDVVTGIQKKRYINAARGTTCGENKWCIEGMCVLKSST